jgi:hypothetical protein
VATTPCTTTGFINTHFFPPCYPATCPVTTFFFHYSAGDQMLVAHEWKNASADDCGSASAFKCPFYIRRKIFSRLVASCARR